jgi:ribosomal protein S18 acetylase RimI-like enzyme
MDQAAIFLHQSWHESYRGHLPEAILKHRDVAYFHTYMQRKKGIAWLAWIGDELAGLVTVASNCVDDIWVKPRYQRRKIASRLIDQAMTHFRVKGFSNAQAGCESFNADAIQFFESIYWKNIGSQSLYADAQGRVEALIYSKQL